LTLTEEVEIRYRTETSTDRADRRDRLFAQVKGGSLAQWM